MKIPAQKFVSFRMFRSSAAGFTLVELMIVSAITVIILGAIVSIYILGQQAFVSGTAHIEIHADARLAMDWISRDARWATRIMTTFNGLNTETNRLIIEIPSIDANGDVIDASTTFDYITYQPSPLDATRLVRVIDADPASGRADGTREIADNLGAFVLSSNGVNLSNVADVTALTEFNITFQMTRAVLGGRINVNDTLTSLVQLRNR
ncbi:MAG: prepilin-type N-terminal cleavage/methylation domain-containing protein [Candidatus Omnitrophota bacterium]